MFNDYLVERKDSNDCINCRYEESVIFAVGIHLCCIFPDVKYCRFKRISIIPEFFKVANE